MTVEETGICVNYLNNVSLIKLSTKYNCSRQKIKRILLMNNISIRTREEANILNRGNTHNYLDGTFFNQFTGYKYVRHEGKQIPEHKLVYMFYNDLAEIPKGYDIHHIDGDKLNNDILNLELMPERDHIHLHQKTNMEVCEDGR